MRGEFGVVEGDEVLLRQAFSNLLRNALEACAGAGSAAAHRDPVARSIAARKSCAIAVTDNGPGVPAGLRERVFQPFFTTKRNGTGLGLALVQKIIVFHNGRIAVTAAPQGGASFPGHLAAAASNRPVS